MFCRPTYDVQDSDEFPVLITATVLLDSLILGLQKRFYASMVRRCTQGHEMHIVEEPMPCSAHNDRAALWGCRSCYKFQPTNRAGEALATLRPIGTNSFCGRCNILLPATSLGFDDNGTVLCKRCAQWPWPVLSTRYLASYNGVLLSIIVAILAISLWRSFFGA